MYRDRTAEIQMLEDTLQICKQGWYEKNGSRIPLKCSGDELKQIEVCLPDKVREISARTDFQPAAALNGRCLHSCINTDSYALARKRIAEGCEKVLVLNLACPVHPGGDVRRGTHAQEEDLCRKSSLLLSLESADARQYYKYNMGLHTRMGSDAVMLTPKVEIIKDENGALLDETVVVSVLTCAAPYVIGGKEGMTEAAYREMVYHRIDGMLKCAAHFGYTELVLGAWGCGAYGNDAEVISDLFRRAITDLSYNGYGENDLFRRIDFAVLKRLWSLYNFKQFSRNFAE